MKYIKLVHMTLNRKTTGKKQNSSYSVFLHSSCKPRFTNIVEARKFLADTNRFLTKKWHQLNYIAVDVYAAYRRMNFMIYYKSIVSQNFYYFDKKLNMAINNSFSQNGNYFTIKHILDSCLMLSTICQLISDIGKTRIIERYNIAHYIDQIQMIKNEIENYRLKR